MAVLSCSVDVVGMVCMGVSVGGCRIVLSSVFHMHSVQQPFVIDIHTCLCFTDTNTLVVLSIYRQYIHLFTHTYITIHTLIGPRRYCSTLKPNHFLQLLCNCVSPTVFCFFFSYTSLPPIASVAGGVGTPAVYAGEW